MNEETEKAFAVHFGHYDEETDENRTVFVLVDNGYLEFTEPLTGISVDGAIALADWLKEGE